MVLAGFLNRWLARTIHIRPNAINRHAVTMYMSDVPTQPQSGSTVTRPDAVLNPAANRTKNAAEMCAGFGMTGNVATLIYY
ncbi:hypothetical protein CENSYa_0281 [Cenarchaeum symbiosum A]|uniref:Uncharacterized protein n=1 Tax=Cenarchaeum symbiosum (strain A) TaxID=414004 RepID=A0RUA4_CENSY|nr:hypothetical protein CENSYa_0281 [Cenarchaeum symbiosum A]